MDKGEVVEEGDHESLMRAHGTYYGLVEKQNLRKAEEEESLAFEKRESAELAVDHQTENNRLNLAKKGASILAKSTSLDMNTLNGKTKNSIIEVDETEGEDGKLEKVIIRIS